MSDASNIKHSSSDPSKSKLSFALLNIALEGVGGQGTLVAGKLLGIVALKLGMDVKVSEVHGMSQRGGSVITYVRMGTSVHSPIIEKGTADFCLAFEELEGLRWSSLLKKSGVMIINRQQIRPLPVLMGKASYPTDIQIVLETASGGEASILEIDALASAITAGSPRAVNMVMLGALSFFTEIPLEIWEESVMEVFKDKPKLIPINLQAFHFGRDLVR
jgi:indolepyruvate ferredoxin oxidoreductase beta subunit